MPNIKKIRWNCNNYVTIVVGNQLSSVRCTNVFITAEDLDKPPVYTVCPKCGEDLDLHSCGAEIIE